MLDKKSLILGLGAPLLSNTYPFLLLQGGLPLTQPHKSEEVTEKASGREARSGHKPGSGSHICDVPDNFRDGKEREGATAGLPVLPRKQEAEVSTTQRRE